LSFSSMAYLGSHVFGWFEALNWNFTSPFDMQQRNKFNRRMS
jgi:hypothetical protein